ncbi:MAG: hypothetical protein ACE5EX_10945, partial [Phycisphaerae bacterium]
VAADDRGWAFLASTSGTGVGRYGDTLLGSPRNLSCTRRGPIVEAGLDNWPAHQEDEQAWTSAAAVVRDRSGRALAALRDGGV